MTQQEIEAYFGQIPVLIKNDVLREIHLARATEGPHKQLFIDLGIAGGGNLLAALGLVSYTEAAAYRLGASYNTLVARTEANIGEPPGRLVQALLDALKLTPDVRAAFSAANRALGGSPQATSR